MSEAAIICPKLHALQTTFWLALRGAPHKWVINTFLHSSLQNTNLNEMNKSQTCEQEEMWHWELWLPYAGWRTGRERDSSCACLCATAEQNLCGICLPTSEKSNRQSCVDRKSNRRKKTCSQIHVKCYTHPGEKNRILTCIYYLYLFFWIEDQIRSFSASGILAVFPNPLTLFEAPACFF